MANDASVHDASIQAASLNAFPLEDRVMNGNFPDQGDHRLVGTGEDQMVRFSDAAD